MYEFIRQCYPTNVVEKTFSPSPEAVIPESRLLGRCIMPFVQIMNDAIAKVAFDLSEFRGWLPYSAPVSAKATECSDSSNDTVGAQIKTNSRCPSDVSDVPEWGDEEEIVIDV